MKSTFVFVILLAMIVISGCDRTNARPSQATQSGKVITTTSFEKYFGGAPSVDKGTAYAFVIYFPSNKEVSKVVPFPFFTFDEGSIRKVAVERLLSGMDIGSYQGEFASFPAGTRLIGVSDDKGVVTLNFSKELAAATDVSVRALALTMRQFNGVKEVRLQTEGKDSPLTTATKNVEEGMIQQPSSPRLLSVTAMRDKGASKVEDVNAFFDRPVEVKELKLLSKDGKQFEGELFHSIFDMAAVLKPKDPTQFKEKMPVRVRWKVVDKLGKPAEGDSIWLLEVKEH